MAEIHWYNAPGLCWLTRDAASGEWRGYNSEHGTRVIIATNWQPWSDTCRSVADPVLRWFAGGYTNLAFNEIDRYIGWPGQALAYKIGQLKMLELRGEAELALGSAFDIRAFHDHLLGAGALPLDILEQRMDQWLTAQLAAAEL